MKRRRWVGPKHWPVLAQTSFLILNAVCVGATAAALHDGTWHWLDLVCLPLNAAWVVWIANAIAARETR